MKGNLYFFVNHLNSIAKKIVNSGMNLASKKYAIVTGKNKQQTKWENKNARATFY